MKKSFTLIAASLMVMQMSAQTVTESKTFDNFYIGINGGVATKMTTPTGGWLNKLDPNVGIRLGRYITPVFGWAIESNAYFSNKPYAASHTAVRALNTSLLGTVNMTNWLCGYEGVPRTFEVSALYGLGWGHFCGHSSQVIGSRNFMTSKAGLDFAFNLGERKAWQLYVEPAVVWGLNNSATTIDKGNGRENGVELGHGGVKYNINRAYAQLNAGIIYKFGNSNGTHNFTIAELRDQAEIDMLNAQINDLRSELTKKPKEVVKEVVIEAPAPKEVRVENLVFVTFAQGKSVLTNDAKTALNSIDKGRHVQIVGTASPEGPAELNQKLSQSRADAVGCYLKERGVIVDEATGKGVQGTTSNRLAIVYVK